MSINNIHEVISKVDINLIDYRQLAEMLMKKVDETDKDLVYDMYCNMFKGHLLESECKELISESSIWSENDVQTLIKKHNIDIAPHTLSEVHCAMEIFYKKFNPIIKKSGESLNSYTWLCLGLEHIKDHGLIRHYFKKK
jgi:hypothetical protein